MTTKQASKQHLTNLATESDEMAKRAEARGNADLAKAYRDQAQTWREDALRA